jgi:hypothetical protein
MPDSKSLGRIVLSSCALAALAACVSSHILIGKARAPISPDQVQLYLHPPMKYEEIAILDTSSRSSLAVTAQGKTNKVIERLKNEPAKSSAAVFQKSGSGLAIYVFPDPKAQ